MTALPYEKELAACLFAAPVCVADATGRRRQAEIERTHALLQERKRIAVGKEPQRGKRGYRKKHSEMAHKWLNWFSICSVRQGVGRKG